MNFDELTINDIKRDLLTKKYSVEQLVKNIFLRIYEIDNEIGAYLTLCEKSAIKQAKEIDKKYRNGEKLGQLAGIPIAIKDNICTENLKTTCGSKMLEDFIPPYDATVVKKLKEAEAIIIGKTNLDEFAMGSSTENSAYKVTKNPRDYTRIPGGSSGGSAASVASGLSFMSLGSDTGGSIRQPASFCGVVGLKPTYGLVSRYGLVAFASSLDQIGPITKNVRDCALTLDVMAGKDILDPTTVETNKEKSYLDSIKEEIKDIKIAMPKEFFPKKLDIQIKNKVKDSIKLLKSTGATIEEISLPITRQSLSAYYIISSAEASSNLARFDGIRYGYRSENYKNINELMVNTRNEAFGKEVKRRIMLGTYALTSKHYNSWYNKAQHLRNKIKKQFECVFQNYDLIISPTSPILPFSIGEKIFDPLDMYLSDLYTVSANLAGLPALSMPCGFSNSNLPIGIQIIGPRFSESKILRTAYALEQELAIKQSR
ncbi:Asp-tRNA(Asn)/Glu-tRNA(Gln) amidotransferase subunit GatA [Serpentinicella sp. ANB-PHB4]|uniref:Asp-tRNA(Asn)/Glu-tRNA(Gln) amidotransferase subunit GatA n=1 Tax=Serpentinicella sp. ANB-PHB4 TaxID=3074076 RepID=UPI00285AC6AD|nr:Asp-tRNA(Asn)/Glu-tRNA(Gln) amidotransferase subunit GatA [Serpentinicella sp. ANB-PHB4]MDR5658084.1 Asp-tRNA(Asn)/Glu-tRNA(Gln) amidotransferase subunit GatA [Serpentinicella sp. ANB-PHB4]